MKKKLEKLIDEVLSGEYGTKNRAKLLETLWSLLDDVNSEGFIY